MGKGQHAGKTIRVTREHVREGRRDSAERCPVALAVNDAIPGAEAEVGLTEADEVRIGPEVYRLPVTAVRWYMVFDSSCYAHGHFHGRVPPEPITFRVGRLLRTVR